MRKKKLKHKNKKYPTSMLMQLQPEQGQLGNWSHSILNSELAHVWLENRGRGVCALQGVGKHKTGKKKKMQEIKSNKH